MQKSGCVDNLDISNVSDDLKSIKSIADQV